MTDELELLRNWDADTAPLTEPARAKARHRLLNTMAHAERHPDTSPSRRHALRLATAAVVAVAVTGTAVLMTKDGADEGDRPDRAGRLSGTAAPRMGNVGAATVLNGAAARAGKQEKPVAPRDDQFIYSKRVITETERRTGAVRTYKDVNWDSVDGSKRSLTMELGRMIWEEPLKKGEGVWPPREWSKLKKLPTDPEKLIPGIIGVGTSSKPMSDFTADDWFDAYFMLGELLKWPVLPQGLRPAAYEALALVPGVKAILGVKDSAGRTGVGIAYPKSPFGQGKYLIFDPESYEFLGFRDERTSASGDKTYIQLSHVVDWAIVDRLKQRP
ncbi:CU044_5270 family protein [Streptomyces sp. NBC_01446]|uniref:CU044_5270 family protein n=1 Tax=Streptomyces sp. NBC_00119 TaxID=2975659 RepID=A0AAU1ULK0_9ACTN|nr:CU044_5270 family protein [Streptomyces sp. NBC_01446]MCX4649530.1 CU044_5270 family protein [Streptomyces sp. NBC_01446]